MAKSPDYSGSDTSSTESEPEATGVSESSAQHHPLSTLNRDVSPPPTGHRKRKRESGSPQVTARAATRSSPALTGVRNAAAAAAARDDDEAAANSERSVPTHASFLRPPVPEELPAVVRSPFRLTRVRDLPAACNVDTVTLGELLGDPLIKEAWLFNFLFDVDFVMQAFDADTRQLVKVNMIHGFGREEARFLGMRQAANAYPNINFIKADMPDRFGTHHTKMMILLRHDDQAQVVVCTANFIPMDWHYMTQAVWRSPLLPLLKTSDGCMSMEPDKPRFAYNPSLPVGSGLRFKHDLMAYIDAYKYRLKALNTALSAYDFTSVRGAFVCSYPDCRPLDKINEVQQNHEVGWVSLKRTLSSVPGCDSTEPGRPTVVMQVSSVATLGTTDAWFGNFVSVLSTKRKLTPAEHYRDEPLTNLPSQCKPPAFKPAPFSNHHYSVNPRIVFPTPDEIRASLGGYDSGGSIHTKITTEANQRQLQYLKPFFRKWSGIDLKQPLDVLMQMDTTTAVGRPALRNVAAPHIKTYMRFTDDTCTKIDWALLTSANMSQQAWGNYPKPKTKGASTEIRVTSYEAGVLVWPELWAEHGQEGKGSPPQMVPTFGADVPAPPTSITVHRLPRVVALRMPYDLPLKPYGADDMPWSLSATHTLPDWRKRVPG